MKVGYSPKVMQLFMAPKNVGRLEDANVTAITGSVACGDMIKLYLKINDKEIIEKITFESYGCAANIATSSMITEIVKGESIEDARKVAFQEVVDNLGGLPKIKFHCAVLAIAGLRIALQKWDYIKGRKELNKDFVETLLKGILDPHTDRDLVSTGAIKNIEITECKIMLHLNIPKDDFFDEIVSNIKEVFELLPVDLEIFSGGGKVAI